MPGPAAGTGLPVKRERLSSAELAPDPPGAQAGQGPKRAAAALVKSAYSLLGSTVPKHRRWRAESGMSGAYNEVSAGGTAPRRAGLSRT